MMIFRFVFLSFLAFFPLSSCGKTYDWRQEVRLVVETPAGEIVGRAVQAVEVTYHRQSMGNEVQYHLVGEAVMVDLGEGRYLFALLGAGAWAERIYRDLGGRPEVYGAIKRQKGKEPRVLAERQYPRLVTFEDINDPASVLAVDPTDLAATFGEGYALKAVTFAITRDAVTDGEVEKVLGWLESIGGGMLDGRSYSTIDAENRLANDLARGSFVRDGNF